MTSSASLPLSCVFNKKSLDKILGTLGNVAFRRESDPTGCDVLEQQLLTDGTSFAVIPAAVQTASSGEGRTSEEHDVKSDTQTPHVATLVVSALVSDKQVDNFRGHEFG